VAQLVAHDPQDILCARHGFYFSVSNSVMLQYCVADDNKFQGCLIRAMLRNDTSIIALRAGAPAASCFGTTDVASVLIFRERSASPDARTGDLASIRFSIGLYVWLCC
jgi:hypothetical protein